MAVRTTALMAAFIPGESPPEVKSPIFLICVIFYPDTGIRDPTFKKLNNLNLSAFKAARK
jgi:hypothetical protein